MTDNSPVKDDFSGNVVKSTPRTFVEAMRVCLKEKYACFNGRASRSEFWYFNLGCFLLGLAVVIVGSILAAVLGKVGFGIMVLLYIAYFLGIIVPSLAVQVRRLHDINQTGWLVLAGIVLNMLAGLGLVFVIVIGVLPPVDVGNKFND
ncbi:DUF805 domain-containing protein [Succinimonas amylolytica]|uniref:DUF805 domain-containing protein n=1 Tax=Succinimonas amylolytica TaxID=83769 RepID=UPI0003699D48|nr:DUF805 domain-containing protein [Succinimonas amylolytica]